MNNYSRMKILGHCSFDSIIMPTAWVIDLKHVILGRNRVTKPFLCAFVNNYRCPVATIYHNQLIPRDNQIFQFLNGCQMTRHLYSFAMALCYGV